MLYTPTRTRKHAYKGLYIVTNTLYNTVLKNERITENSQFFWSSSSYDRHPSSFGHDEEITHLEHTGANASGKDVVL